MKRISALTISLAAALLMCLAMTGAAFAADGIESGVAADIEATAEMANVEAALADQMAPVAPAKDAAQVKTSIKTVTAVSMNSTAKANPVYTPTATKMETYEYTIKMPAAGTLALSYTALNGDGYARLTNASTTGSTKFTESGYSFRTSFYYLSAGSHKMEFSVYSPSSGSNQGVFFVQYAPSSSFVVPNTGKVYYHGAPGNSNKFTYFKVKAPGKGYFTLTLGDGTGSDYPLGINMKMKGFKDFDYLSESSKDIGNIRWIGAKKGTYTVTVKTSNSIYGVKSKFKKVKESKYGAKKKKAAKIKKKKTVKGVIITNSKKAHWYKFKNPKKQKVKLVFKSSTTGGGKYSGLKVTVYGKGSSFFKTISAGKGKTVIQPYTLGAGSKLKKGTYYIKVESYEKAGTGYYTLTWK